MSGFINDNKGHVRVYDYTPTGTSSWTQVGGDIHGDTNGDEFGIRVSFSSDGTILAISAFKSWKNGVESGYVRIYEYTPSFVSSWTQLGQDIDPRGKCI